VSVVRSVTVVEGDGRRGWGILVALGAVSFLFGVLVLANLWSSVRLAAVLAGLFLVFAGVAQMVAGWQRADGRGGRLALAAVATLLGLLLVLWPDASVKTVAVLVGLAFLLAGAAACVVAVQRAASRGPLLAVGLAGVLLGLVVVLLPGPTVGFLMALVGLSAMAFGVLAVVQGLLQRRG
jgi:uncharacterized membrane protein HdeD (DUF308 family)